MIRPVSTKFEVKYFYKLIRSKGWQHHASWRRTQNKTQLFNVSDQLFLSIFRGEGGDLYSSGQLIMKELNKNSAILGGEGTILFYFSIKTLYFFYLFRIWFFFWCSTLTNYCKHFPKSISREFISRVGYLFLNAIKILGFYIKNGRF